MSRDKRLTIHQAVKEIQYAYDYFEKVCKRVLKEEFGFGPKRMARFEEKFKASH